MKNHLNTIVEKAIKAPSGHNTQPWKFKIHENEISILPDKAFMDELTHWIRFNKTAGEETGDGLYGRTAGNPSVPKWIGEFIMNITMSPENEAQKYADFIQSSSALIVFIAKRNDKKAWVNVGRSFERMALTATSFNINHAHENMPCEELAIRQKLMFLFHLKNGEQPLLLTRIGYSEKMPYSFRRSLTDVLIIN